MKRRKPSDYILFIIASIALHLFMFFGFIFLNDYLFFSELFKRLDHQVVDKTQDLSTQIELIDIKENQKQFVEQSDKSLNEKAPEDAKFISKNDQTVEKETKARLNGAFQNSKAQRPSPQVSEIKTKPSETTVQKLLQSRPAFQPTGPLALKGLRPSNDLQKVMERQNKQMEELQQKAITQEAQALSPFSSPSATDDYLKDIIDGDFTALNTKRFKHYSFYSRVKGQLRSHWSPLIRQEVYFVYSTKRSLASLDKKRTTLRVTLDKDGYLKKVELLTTSGNDKVDMAAIQAFRTAAPFPNPPEELLEKDGKLRLFWDFVLET